MVDLFHLIFDV